MGQVLRFQVGPDLKEQIFQLLGLVPLQHQGQRRGLSITAVWRLMCPSLVQRHSFCQTSIGSSLEPSRPSESRRAAGRASVPAVCLLLTSGLSLAVVLGGVSHVAFSFFPGLALVFRLSVQYWPPLLCVFMNPFFFFLGSDCFCVIFLVVSNFFSPFFFFC